MCLYLASADLKCERKIEITLFKVGSSESQPQFAVCVVLVFVAAKLPWIHHRG